MKRETYRLGSFARTQIINKAECDELVHPIEPTRELVQKNVTGQQGDRMKGTGQRTRFGHDDELILEGAHLRIQSDWVA